MGGRSTFAEIQLVSRAVREGWFPLTDEEGRRLVLAMLREMESNPVGAVRVSAARVALMARAQAERERYHRSQERTQGDRTQLEALRLALSRIPPDQLATYLASTLPPQCTATDTDTPVQDKSVQ